MSYGKVKVYSDGTHYIGIPYVPNPRSGKRYKPPEDSITVADNTTTELAPENGTDTAVGCDSVTTVKENDETAAHTQQRLTRKELFEELYRKSAEMRRRERKAFIQREMLPYFKDSTTCHAFVENQFERKSGI